MSTETEASSAFEIKKLAPFFVDEISNISISPNGASRVQFVSWQTDDQGEPLRVDSELIMTTKTLSSLATNLPRAIRQANKVMQENRTEAGENR